MVASLAVEQGALGGRASVVVVGFGSFVVGFGSCGRLP